MNQLIQITPPAAEPITLDDMLQELGYGPAANLDAGFLAILDGRLTSKIMSARIECENYTRTAYITQTWQMLLDGFPGRSMLYNDHPSLPSIRLPRSPLQTISEFAYVDTQGATQTLLEDTSNGNNNSVLYGYQLQKGTDTQPPRIVAPWARIWPPTRRIPASVLITYTCGYGPDAASVPAPILLAIRFLAQFYYEQGSAADAPIPRVVANLLEPYCNRIS
jgi:uncharacterized phiE125 gp8 family phage protein